MTVTKFDGGPHAHDFDKLPLWLVAVIVFRAGFVEELFYRGYRHRAVAVAGMAAGSGGHRSAGDFRRDALPPAASEHPGGVHAGRDLDGCSILWRRDLVANIIGHFLVDFIANVVPRLFGPLGVRSRG